jgi:hypothetical protein
MSNDPATMKPADDPTEQVDPNRPRIAGDGSDLPDEQTAQRNLEQEQERREREAQQTSQQQRKR